MSSRPCGFASLVSLLIDPDVHNLHNDRFKFTLFTFVQP
jgi:hypothetical protein